MRSTNLSLMATAPRVAFLALGLAVSLSACGGSSGKGSTSPQSLDARSNGGNQPQNSGGQPLTGGSPQTPSPTQTPPGSPQTTTTLPAPGPNAADPLAQFPLTDLISLKYYQAYVAAQQAAQVATAAVPVAPADCYPAPVYNVSTIPLPASPSAPTATTPAYNPTPACTAFLNAQGAASQAGIDVVTAKDNLEACRDARVYITATGGAAAALAAAKAAAAALKATPLPAATSPSGGLAQFLQKAHETAFDSIVALLAAYAAQAAGQPETSDAVDDAVGQYGDNYWTNSCGVPTMADQLAGAQFPSCTAT